ncbi:MAG TPA: 5'-deoxynucleotidase [Bacillota bacterium]|nr:5'-deoxynucleotidase [Bacillota bacterium]HOK68818.1 5'-deoxynucleotidase [Bacillota bacterium]HPP84891.1 5'-deoxynucleotidase [Bacillota bacterium]
MPNAFFAMMFRMKYIRRWGIMRAIVPESLSTHSMEVAVTAHALAIIGNKYFGKNYDCERIATKAIYHDLPEILTGDIPTPVKYFNNETKTAYDKVEKAALKKFLCSLPEELADEYKEMFCYTPEEKKIIKAADKICAYLKCREEERGGNMEFSVAKKALSESIAKLNCEEADYFLKEFSAGFDMPIDTLIEE